MFGVSCVCVFVMFFSEGCDILIELLSLKSGLGYKVVKYKVVVVQKKQTHTIFIQNKYSPILVWMKLAD